MKISLIRWFIFISIGLPIQLLMYILYPIAYLGWRLFIFEKVEQKLLPTHSEGLVLEIPETRNGGLFLNNPDDHGAFTMYGFIQTKGLECLITKDGDFSRRLNEDWTHNLKNVSGDAVVAWTFAATFTEVPKNAVKRAIKNYLKYLGSRSYNPENHGWVSNKCNNMGLNYCPDGYLGLGQPAAGPQFYTTSSLLALGYNLGIGYKLAFWAHWVVMGGWFWAFWPMIYTKNQPLNYVRDISMKALYVHLQVFGPRWWVVKPMKFITYKISKYRNDLFYAMFGKKPLESFPEYTSPFFSQKEPPNAQMDSYSNSKYLKQTLEQITKNSRIVK